MRTTARKHRRHTCVWVPMHESMYERELPKQPDQLQAHGAWVDALSLDGLPVVHLTWHVVTGGMCSVRCELLLISRLTCANLTSNGTKEVTTTITIQLCRNPLHL